MVLRLASGTYEIDVCMGQAAGPRIFLITMGQVTEQAKKIRPMQTANRTKAKGSYQRKDRDVLLLSKGDKQCKVPMPRKAFVSFVFTLL